MKNFRLAVRALQLALISFSTVFCVVAAQAEEPLRAEAVLVWGTNDPQSPDPKHVPVDDELARKLNRSPYKWKHYFKVKSEMIELRSGETRKNLAMSRHCALDIKNLGTDRVEIKLYGDGKLVSSNNERLVENWPLSFGGSAGNETAWFVVIRKVHPGMARPVPPPAPVQVSHPKE